MNGLLLVFAVLRTSTAFLFGLGFVVDVTSNEVVDSFVVSIAAVVILLVIVIAVVVSSCISETVFNQYLTQTPDKAKMGRKEDL